MASAVEPGSESQVVTYSIEITTKINKKNRNIYKYI